MDRLEHVGGNEQLLWSRKPGHEKYLSLPEVMRETGITDDRWALKDSKDGRMPMWTRFGRFRAWEKDEIEAWLRYKRPMMSEWDRSKPPQPMFDFKIR